MSIPFAEFVGDAIYVDTMIPYALLRGLEPMAQTVFSRVQAGELVAYTSVLTFDELVYRLLLARIRDEYDGSPLDRLRNDEAQMIAEFYPEVSPHLRQLRNFPNLVVVDITSEDVSTMDEAMRQHHVRPRDALHLAAMQKCACLNLLSNDSDFDRVSRIQRYYLS